VQGCTCTVDFGSKHLFCWRNSECKGVQRYGGCWFQHLFCWRNSECKGVQVWWFLVPSIRFVGKILSAGVCIGMVVVGFKHLFCWRNSECKVVMQSLASNI